MTLIDCVRGAVDSSQLGITLMHEHIFVLTSDVQQNYTAGWGSEEDRIAEAVARLRRLFDAGVRTIVDQTVVGLGRYIPRIQRIAEQIPLQIVAATGLYTCNDIPLYFAYRGPALDEMLGHHVPDPMVDMFIDDIRQGIAGTGVRAGMLKCAIDEPGLTPGVERIMRAVAKAQLETGVPITVHTHPQSHTGLAVKRVMCDEEGVHPSRIVLGHSGDTADCDHLSELADYGFVLGMDRFGLNLETTFEARAETLVEMVRRGYADRMVLSHDANCYIDWVDPTLVPMLPQWHYTHLFDDVVPYVSALGVTQDDIATMLITVPRRVLERG
jgi:phosphotriesterase-related protein